MNDTFNSKNTTKILIGIFLILLLVGVMTIVVMEDDSPSGATPWSYSTPEEQGFDSAVLVELLQSIKTENLDIHSMILMRNKRIFLEFYAHPYGPNTLQHTMSVGKSVTSALVGIALKEGLIPNLEIPIINSFPEYLPTITDPRKLKITLRHALNMTTGGRQWKNIVYSKILVSFCLCIGEGGFRSARLCHIFRKNVTSYLALLKQKQSTFFFDKPLARKLLILKYI